MQIMIVPYFTRSIKFNIIRRFYFFNTGEKYLNTKIFEWIKDYQIIKIFKIFKILRKDD